MNQSMLAAPDDETPTMAVLHMVHVGPLSPLWLLLDCQPTVETLHLLNLEEFADLINGCAPDALVRNSFVILSLSQGPGASRRAP